MPFFVADIDRESLYPIHHKKHVSGEPGHVIKTHLGNSDFIVYNVKTILKPQWNEKLKDIPDNVDMVFMADNEMTGAPPSQVSEDLYMVDVRGCMNAFYISGKYASKLKELDESEIENRISLDILNGDITACKYLDQPTICHPDLPHYNKDNYRKNKKYAAINVYTSYLNVGLAILLLVLFMYSAKKLLN